MLSVKSTLHYICRFQILFAIILVFTNIAFYIGSYLWIWKRLMRLLIKASFRRFKCFNVLKKCFRNSVNEKHLSGNTFSTCWNVTTAQIVLKDKDDIDVLWTTNSSPKKVLPLVLSCKWQVLKTKILGKYDFPNQHSNTLFFLSVGFHSAPLRRDVLLTYW